MMRQFMLTTIASVLLLGCTNANPDLETKDVAESAPAQAAQTLIADKTNSAKLGDILASFPEDVKLRYAARNPKETLEFFGLEPGMTAIEVLPGGGWYSKILSPYLGTDGHLIGVDYSLKMWPEFGGFATPEFIKARENWGQSWIKNISERSSLVTCW